MATIPINITSFGIGSDNLADNFHIWFLSVHNAKKLYYGDECVTENISDALTTDDINFATEELSNLLKDQEFLNYLEAEVVL